MYEINWNRFNIKNPDSQKKFEEMCRHLFCRKFKISGYEFTSNYNQTGIETEPIKHDNKYYGFQCKYNETSNNFYQQLFKSLKKAFNIYPRLDYVIVYTNLNIMPNISIIDMKKENSIRVKIHELAKKNNVELKWIKKENFSVILNETENLDLYRHYFSSQNELGFLEAALTPEDRTFLISKYFMDLPINKSVFSQLQDQITREPFSVLTGHAGTGKSELMKKMFLNYEKEYINKIKTPSCSHTSSIPIFIKLRECSKGDLENLLRQRLRDYDICTNNEEQEFVYFFDGFDEIVIEDIGSVIAYFNLLKAKPGTKSIVVSSRINTPNLAILFRESSPSQYNIDPLPSNMILQYFERRENASKLENLNNLQNSHLKILKEITDIFSVTLLWENIHSVSNDTTKIDLISLSIENLLNLNRKVPALNLPEPKISKIKKILSEISLNMHKSGNLNISISEFQKTIKNLFPDLNYCDIDKIIHSVSELFFDTSNLTNNQTIYSYRHKRYFEFFLYQTVKQLFYDDPFILRELKLLTNKDFILNIFLTQELKENMQIENLHKVLILRWLETYLGKDYCYGYKNPFVGEKFCFGVGHEDFLKSKCFHDYLCSKNLENLKTFLKTDPFFIKSFLKIDNYWSFIKNYHLFQHEDIRPLLKIKNEEEVAAINEDPCSYWYCNCILEHIPVEQIYEKNIKKLTINTINMEFDYYLNNLTATTITVDFFEMALCFFPDWLLGIIDDLSINQLEVLSFIFLKTGTNKYLHSNDTKITSIKETICNCIRDNHEIEYKINTVVFYNIFTNGQNQLKDIKKHINEVNLSHYGTWARKLDLNSYAAIILGDEFKSKSSEYLLGIDIRRIFLNNYPANKEKIFDQIIEEVKKYNLIYDNRFSYNSSSLLGELIAGLEFHHEQIKSFVSELKKYGSVISLFTVLYKIMTKNKPLFKIIANPKLIFTAYENVIKHLSYYDENTDISFMYATMISCFDIASSDVLFNNALNNSIFRPPFRGEDMISNLLPQCILIAYQNDWLTNEQLESAVERLYSMLNIAKNTLDNGSSFEALKYVIEKCIPNSPFLSELTDVTAFNPISNKFKGIKDINNIELTAENLLNIYDGKVENVNYSSISVWRELIQYELTLNPELPFLYQMFDKLYFPNPYYDNISSYFDIITSILLENQNTKNKIIQYLMKNGGRIGLVNMIKVFSITGEEKKVENTLIH